MTELYALGFGVGTQNANNEWLEVFYPQPLLNPSANIAKAAADVLGYEGGNQAIALDNDKLASLADALEAAGSSDQAAVVKSLQNSKRPLVATVLGEDSAPSSVPEGYLKLHLISHRLVKPHATILDGLFGTLPNVACLSSWSSKC